MAEITPKKVIIGMSGGVDSSVAAHLLLKQGFEVEGLFMKNWEEERDDGYCPQAKDLLDAEAVCYKLGIKLHTVNFAKDYWDNVFSEFLEALKMGYTPNPDVLCNKEIKFKVFLEHAEKLGADKIATGHYARIQQDNGIPTLHKGLDQNKDQSYFLHQLTTAQLAKSIFPIGEYEKPAIREIAKSLRLKTHNKKDSTGICFIGERKFKTFLQNYLPTEPGDILNPSGQVIGKHDGLMYYTIGQRQGLNIGGRKDASGAPWYVVQKNLNENTLIVCEGTNHPMLYADTLWVENLHWIGDEYLNQPLMAKTRYRQQDQACQVSVVDNRYEVSFATPQRAITPGQYLVLYKGSACLGGGVIAQKLLSNQRSVA